MIEMDQLLEALQPPAPAKHEGFVDCGHTLPTSLRNDVVPCHGEWADWCVDGGDLPESELVDVRGLPCYKAGTFMFAPTYVAKDAIDAIQSGDPERMSAFLVAWHARCYKDRDLPEGLSPLGISGLVADEAV